MIIKYSDMFDLWLRIFGFTIVEQCNICEYISFHSWENREVLFSTKTDSTVAIWTVKKKVL